MISPQGFIFDKEAILSYILDQKKCYKRKLQIWEEQMKMESEKEVLKQHRKEEELKAKFMSIESTPAHLTIPETPNTTSKALKRRFSSPAKDEPSSSNIKKSMESVSNMEGEKAKEWKSFWVPELVPTAEATKIEKPSEKVVCPLSGNPLKFKDLLPVKFMPSDDETNHSKIVAKTTRYICPVTRDVLTNTSRCAYLKPSQYVVSMRCIDLIRKDMLDPLSGTSLDDSDIVELQRGGTGFSATNDLKAKLIRPQLELQ